jgi:monovalent cation/hydrogen antiporter
MLVFEIVIALLLSGAALSALARRIGAPYPALVALAGAVLAVLPGTPILLLDPQLALALFVAPVLLDAAFDASPRDLRRNWQPVAGLSVGAVVVTVAFVAVVVRALVPDMSWPAAIALGAIVAPPDAAAATAVLNQVRPPYRLLVILEGESLFNDASALLIYRLAIGAAVAGTVVSWSVLPMILGVTAGSIVLGVVAARIVLFFGARIREVSTAVIMQFSSTFAVWLLAERLHLSGILTMVVYAMVTSRTASDVIPARIRIPSYAVWEVAVFVLNVLAFILVGLQLKPIVSRLDRSAWLEYMLVAAAVCIAAILARLIWVVAVGSLSVLWCHARRHRAPNNTDPVALSPRAALLVGWCGMRGIVTLAAALALPNGQGGASFPHRDLILFTAFSVVLGTLVLQGLTLRPIMTRLRLDDDGAVDREVQLARVATIGAALEATAGSSGTETVELMRRRYDLQLRRANLEPEGTVAGQIEGNHRQPMEVQLPPREDIDVVRAAVAAERQRLSALRADGTIGDAAFQRVEQELDWRELDLEQFFRPGQSAP